MPPAARLGMMNALEICMRVENLQSLLRRTWSRSTNSMSCVWMMSM